MSRDDNPGADRFWERLSLTEMSEAQWESLCDGCAKCCLHKLEDAVTGAITQTNVACRLLDMEACRCTRYPDRHRLVKDCIDFSEEVLASLTWLPRSCAYRRVAEGRGLADWHPLVSGSADSVHRAGVSVLGRVIPAGAVHEDEFDEHLIHWVET